MDASRPRPFRRGILAATALGLLMAACGGSTAPTTQRYYDPRGLFSAEFPQANEMLVVAPQPVANAPKILSGVLSQVSQANPQVTTGPFGALGGATPATDQAVYAVFVVDAKQIGSVQTLADTLLASSPPSNLQVLSAQLIGGRPGLLIVNDHPTGGYTDASGYVLMDGVGYWIRELFPIGEWSRRSPAFLDMLRSFQFDVPPPIVAIPIGRRPLLLRSGTYWPVG
jgi:hypothetical protein